MTLLGNAGSLVSDKVRQLALSSLSGRHATPPYVPTQSVRAPCCSVTSRLLIVLLGRPPLTSMVVHLPFSNLTSPPPVPTQSVRCPAAPLVSIRLLTQLLGSTLPVSKTVHLSCSNRASPPPSVPAHSVR